MLPELNKTVTHKIKLPISGTEMTIRPYLVGEEKILLTAMETEDGSDIPNAIRQVISNCTFGQPIDALSWIDIEYLMLKLKMYSAGEIVELHIKCRNKVKKPTVDPLTLPEGTEPEMVEVECGAITDIAIDLSKDITVDTSKIKDNVIKLTDTIAIGLRPPRFQLLERMLSRETETAMAWDAIAECVDYVVNGDEIIRDFSADEVEKFIDSFNSKQLKAVRDYVDSLPKLEVRKEFKCDACNYSKTLVLRNFKDFFTE